MILLFPDLDTFRLVLTGGFVPADITLSDATVSFDTAGQLAVETNGKLLKKTTSDLTRLGVNGVKRHLGEVESVSCWLQILPVVRDPVPPQLSSQAPVLFELEAANDLPVIVGEMLRLGNDRQSFRWLASDADGPDKRVLLRVIGPPYYTLLRAFDQTATDSAGAIRAYTEHAPRVWVQLGFTHPFAAQIKTHEDQAVFLRPGREWVYLPEAPYSDVYEILNFQLPADPVDWVEAEVREKLAVPLRLVAGNAADAPEMWVLRDAAVDQLDAFVRDADERITHRLKFAVASDANDNTVIVLRVTTSKLAPPVLSLAGVVGFKPYYKLPNLYLPVGTRLHPTLRRDAVRKLLADDTDQLVWLFPSADGTFTPETLPEDSFRPLEDWVDYVIETNHVSLSAWVDATRFDFEHFICSDAKPPKGPDDKDAKKRRTKTDADEGPLAPATPDVKWEAKKPASNEEKPQPLPFVVPTEAKPPGEWLLRRQVLEKEFLASEGVLDAPERLKLWPQLAEANTGYGDTQEAAICWINAMWQYPVPPQAWLEGWLRSEIPAATLPITAVEFDKRMKLNEPTIGEFRQFAAMTLWQSYQTKLPAWFLDRLQLVQRHLEAHESKLQVRALWLVMSRIAQLNGADTLGLARVRDRILQRLLEEGMKPERDVPFFLRSAGLKDSERIRHVREKALELHGIVKAWAESSMKQPASMGHSDQMASLGYMDLFFAFGLAKLGESTPARALVESARHVLENFKPTEDRGVAASFLFKALRFRVEQAIAAKPHAGVLDVKVLDELDSITKQSNINQKSDNPNRIGLYAISRMREQSRILEPQEKLDPYHEYMKENDELRKALTELPKTKDPIALSRTIRELYRNGVNGKPTADNRFMVLVNALPLAGRVGEPFTVELLNLVPETMRAVGTATGPQQADLPKKQGQLLERGLFLAAHFDRREVMQQLVDQFVELMKSKSEEQRYELVNIVAGQCLRSLRKLGLRDEIDKLLHRMQDVIFGGQTPQKLRERYTTKPELWGKALQSLLNLAGGWLTFGLSDQAAPILDIAREELIGPTGMKLASKDFTPLAQAYVAALGQGPAETGLPRIAELFRKMEPGRIVNSFTTSKFYSRFHLNLVEEVVLAVVSDDFALGPAARRWFDEDEYLVRRRIHADMKQHLQKSGL